MMLGQVPDSRTRQTLTARLRQALPADTYLEADYRHYFDDWQVHSNALSVGLSHHFTPTLLQLRLSPIRPDGRFSMSRSTPAGPAVLHGGLPARAVHLGALHREGRS